MVKQSNKNKFSFFVYALVDPIDGRIKYIGYSKDPEARLSQHRADVGSTEKRKWIKALNGVGLDPQIVILASGTEDHCKRVEREAILFHQSIQSDLINGMNSVRDGAYLQKLIDERDDLIAQLATQKEKR